MARQVRAQDGSWLTRLATLCELATAVMRTAITAYENRIFAIVVLSPDRQRVEEGRPFDFSESTPFEEKALLLITQTSSQAGRDDRVIYGAYRTVGYCWSTVVKGRNGNDELREPIQLHHVYCERDGCCGGK